MILRMFFLLALLGLSSHLLSADKNFLAPGIYKLNWQPAVQEYVIAIDSGFPTYVQINPLLHNRDLRVLVVQHRASGQYRMFYTSKPNLVTDQKWCEGACFRNGNPDDYENLCGVLPSTKGIEEFDRDYALYLHGHVNFPLVSHSNNPPSERVDYGVFNHDASSFDLHFYGPRKRVEVIRKAPTRKETAKDYIACGAGYCDPAAYGVYWEVYRLPRYTASFVLEATESYTDAYHTHEGATLYAAPDKKAAATVLPANSLVAVVSLTEPKEGWKQVDLIGERGAVGRGWLTEFRNTGGWWWDHE